MSVLRLLDFRVTAWIFIAKLLFRWGLLYKTSFCEPLSLDFLKGAGFDVCLFQAALLSGRKFCFYWAAVISACFRICLRRLTVRYDFCGCGPWKLTLLRYISRFLFLRDKWTAQCAVPRAKAHLTWLKWVGRLCTWCIIREVEKWRRCHTWRRFNGQHIWPSPRLLFEEIRFLCQMT